MVGVGLFKPLLAPKVVMSIKNSSATYGSLSILIHWGVALVVFGLFGLGLWMVELDYYSTWYHKAPAIHKGIGVLLLLAMVFRLVWRKINPVPEPEPGQQEWEIKAAEAVHLLLYLLIFAVLLSGYLISTADGKPVDVFGLFSLPAIISGLPKQGDIAGWVHLILAIGLVSLAVFHALAAIKHHVIDRDATLKRMLGLKKAGATPLHSFEKNTEIL